MAESSYSSEIRHAIEPTRRLVGEKVSANDSLVFKDNGTEEIVSTVNSCNTATHKRREVLDANDGLQLMVQAQNVTAHNRTDGHYRNADSIAYGKKVFTACNKKVIPDHTNITVSLTDTYFASLYGVPSLNEDASMERLKVAVALAKDVIEKFEQKRTDEYPERETQSASINPNDTNTHVPLLTEMYATLGDPMQAFILGKEEQRSWWKKITGHGTTDADIEIKGSWSRMTFIIFLPKSSTTIAKVSPLDQVDKFTVDIFGNVDALFVISLIAALAVMKSPSPLDYAGLGKKILCGAGFAAGKEAVDYFV
ncbi:uncharacterized protein LOC143576809 [Bidens hawaiensis]|uniref:uncharacterized protein LOC143576809 n=1 Tax=Bidens hawaiensis TaxID=980011 RepID=UPI00404A3D74